MKTQNRYTSKMIHLIHFMTHFMEMTFLGLILFISDDSSLFTAALHQERLAAAAALGFPLFLMFGITALPWGYAADRFSGTRILGISTVTAGSGAILAGCSQNTTALSISLGIMGLGMAGYHPSGIALISRSSKQGKDLAVNGIWGSAGMMIGPAAAGIAAHVFGWRSVFFIAGSICVLLGAAAFCIRNRSTPLMQAEQPQQDKGLQRLMVPALINVGIVVAFLGIAYRMMMTGLPELLQKQGGQLVTLIQQAALFIPGRTEAASNGLSASVLLSAILPLGILGQALGGRVADRFDLRYSYLVFFALPVPALILCAYLEGLPLILAACIPILFIHGSQPIENSLIARCTPPRYRSRIYALKFTLAFGIGSAAVLIISKALNVLASIQSIFLIAAGIELIVVIAQTILIMTTGNSGHRFRPAATATNLPLTRTTPFPDPADVRNAV